MREERGQGERGQEETGREVSYLLQGLDTNIPSALKGKLVPVFHATREKRLRTSVASAGNQPKVMVEDFWAKADGNAREGLSESIVSCLMQSCPTLDGQFVEYKECIVIDSSGMQSPTIRRGCYALNFLKQGQEWVPLSTLLEHVFCGFDKYQRIAQGMQCKELMQLITKVIADSIYLDITDYLCKTFMLDALTVNKDRHFRNLGVIREGDTFRISPIFDNGMALLGSYNFEQQGLKEIIDDLDGQPFGNFSARVAACRELGAQPLSIDLEQLHTSLKHYNSVLYSRQEVMYCAEVLRLRFQELEGLAWKAIK